MQPIIFLKFQEILELRNLYEHHREEMMHLAKSSPTPTKKMPLQNADTQTPTKSPTKYPRLYPSRQPLSRAFESESDFDISMQEEQRRIEFQQRRLRQMQKKKCQNRSDTQFENQNQSKMHFDQPNRNDMRLDNLNRSAMRLEPLSTPNFSIGSPTTPVATAPVTKNPAISSFFPAVPSNNTHKDPFSNSVAKFSNHVNAFSIESQDDDAMDGRRVAVVGGNDVFIPRLDLDELVFIILFSINKNQCQIFLINQSIYSQLPKTERLVFRQRQNPIKGLFELAVFGFRLFRPGLYRSLPNYFEQTKVFEIRTDCLHICV